MRNGFVTMWIAFLMMGNASGMMRNAFLIIRKAFVTMGNGFLLMGNRFVTMRFTFHLKRNEFPAMGIAKARLEIACVPEFQMRTLPANWLDYAGRID